MTDLRATKTNVLAAAEGTAALRVATTTTLGAVEFTNAQRIDNQKTYVLAAVDTTGEPDIVAPKAYVLAAVRGRVGDPKIRAWTYTQDGHDFYVIRLGGTETLVYDNASEEWSIFGSADTDLWRAYNGINWPGSGGLAYDYGSNVIVGDDVTGALYFLDPESPTDDDPVAGIDVQIPFTREIEGQVLSMGYGRTPCFGVDLRGSIGQQDSGLLTSVTLLTSDDRGANYVDRGTLTTPVSSYDFRVNWRSLGAFPAPGRLFRIKDDGALARIDGLTMTDNAKV